MQSFQMKSFAFEKETGILYLSYGYGEYEFHEEIIFPGAPFNEKRVKEMERVFFLTHVALGISYFKAFCPLRIEVLSGELSLDEASFFEKFYLSGLGEFAIRNGLNLQGKIHFPYSEGKSENSLIRGLGEGIFLAVGGGKDSCVSIEMLKQKRPTLFSIGMAKPIRECVEASGLSFIQVQRKISPELLSLNKQGKVYNGHVPITGINAFLSLCLALLHQKKYVVLSNERSANVGNMRQGELEINHQWSKSIEFERSFYNLTKKLAPDFLYFSILRLLTEIHIAKLFALKCKQYHSIFTSCNKVFRIDKEKRLSHWCRSCDKCRFVFLILAPFMKKEKWIKIFGSDPLDEEKQEEGYKELLGISGHKPFECVGEVSECRYAWSLLRKSPEWREDFLLRKIKVDEEGGDFFQESGENMIPEVFQNAFNRFIR